MDQARHEPPWVALPASAKALGYRMPAEWTPQTCVWLSPPFNPESWPGCLDKAQAQFAALMDAMRPFVTLRTTQELGILTNDSWIRDYGPIFVTRPRDQGTQGSTAPAPLPPLACHDFTFNGWGGKYDVRDLDDAVPRHIARHLQIPAWRHQTILEGGSIEVNGAGTVLTTRQCLLNRNRNPHMSEEEIEHELHEALGTSHVIWLPGGIIGDDTDGHIDDIARFVNATTVVHIMAPPGHPDHDTLTSNAQVLRQARDQDGRALDLVELPVPAQIFYDFPAGRFREAGRNPVPASYANFLISNGAAFVPVFGQHSDEVALRLLEQAMPRHRVIGVRAEFLVVGLGAFHCLSQQQPATGGG